MSRKPSWRDWETASSSDEEYYENPDDKRFKFAFHILTEITDDQGTESLSTVHRSWFFGGTQKQFWYPTGTSEEIWSKALHKRVRPDPKTWKLAEYHEIVFSTSLYTIQIFM